MKAIAIKKFLQWHLPLTLLLFLLVTIERQVTGTDGGFTRLKGFPLPFISNAFACTMCYDVFVLAMLIDLAACFLLLTISLKLLERTGVQLRTHTALMVVAVLVSIGCVAWFGLITSNSIFYLTNNSPYETTHRQLSFGLLNP